MTFVRVRLALDQMNSGQVLCVELCGDEPLTNVPRSAAELGHTVEGPHRVETGLSRLWIRKR